MPIKSAAPRGAATIRPPWSVHLTTLGLLVLGIGTSAYAGQCTTTPTCVPTTVSPGCDLGSSGSWSCHHVPHTGDRWDIQAGHVAIVKAPAPTLAGLGTVHGTLLFDETTGSRDGA